MLQLLFRRLGQVAKICKLDARLSRMLKKQPNRIKARHMYFGLLQKMSSARRRGGAHSSSGLVASRGITARHSLLFRMLRGQYGEELGAAVEQLRDERTAEILSNMESIRDQRAKLENETVASFSDKPCCRVGSCRFSENQMHRFTNLLESRPHGRSYIE